jgi:hypothetical protein
LHRFEQFNSTCQVVDLNLDRALEQDGRRTHSHGWGIGS